MNTESVCTEYKSQTSTHNLLDGDVDFDVAHIWEKFSFIKKTHILKVNMKLFTYTAVHSVRQKYTQHMRMRYIYKWASLHWTGASKIYAKEERIEWNNNNKKWVSDAGI